MSEKLESQEGKFFLQEKWKECQVEERYYWYQMCKAIKRRTQMFSLHLVIRKPLVALMKQYL